MRALLRAGDLAGLVAGDELTRMRRQVASQQVATEEKCLAGLYGRLYSCLRQCHAVSQ